MIFEEFEMLVEKWQDYEQEFTRNKDSMLEEAEAIGSE
jgi:hypothetical protein